MPPRTRFGLTWWGQRWIGALEALGALYANRLPRGRTYARKGSVTDLRVTAGEVTARVHGRRAQPYRVRLRLPVFDDAAWEAVTTALAGQLRHAAALLDGQMPEDVDEVLAGCGVSLFPRPGELDTTCSCPDYANPCKHVAAVHYTLAETFDADPFLLPALRGRDRAALLAGLRAARAGGEVVAEEGARYADGVALTDLSAAELWDARADLSAIPVHPAPPRDPTALLRRLGAPPGCPPAVVERLEELAETAAARAWAIASGEGEDDDPVLAALRLRGSATTRDLAVDLDRDVEAVRADLRRLVEAGTVRRTGHARSTRYHA